MRPKISNAASNQDAVSVGHTYEAINSDDEKIRKMEKARAGGWRDPYAERASAVPRPQGEESDFWAQF
jgi:hypothetical protein